MKATVTSTKSTTRERQSTTGRRASQRLERLEAGYRDLRFRLDRLQQTLDAAVAGGELTLATVDPENLDSLRRFEDGRLREAGRRLKVEMKSLRAGGVVDARGRRVRKDVPPDMREGTDCDL